MHRSWNFGLRSVLCLTFSLAVTTVAIAAPPPGKGGGGGKNDPSLSLAVTPESFSESSSETNPSAVTGTVTRENSDTSVSLWVTLTSNDESEATVPDNVEIPAFETSVDFTVTAVNDPDEDGSQTVTISATASGHSDGSSSVTVTDDETVNVGYRVQFIPIPENASSSTLYDVNDFGQAVGNFLVPDLDRDLGNRYVSFLYDAVSGKYISSDQMITLDPQWIDVSFVGINNFGAIVGSVENLNREIKAGILIYPDGESWSYEILPSPESSSRSWARKINDFGDIVGTYYVETPWQDEGAPYGAFAINTGLYSDADILPLTDFQIPVRVWPVISRERVGIVQNLDGALGFDFEKAYTLYDGDPGNDQEPVSLIPVPSENYNLSQNAISNDGQLAASERVLVSNKRGGTYENKAAVIQHGVLLWKADFAGGSRSVNSAVGGNIVGDVLGASSGKWWIQHADRGYLEIEDMLVFDDEGDRLRWNSTPHYITDMSDREDTTPFGYLAGHPNGGPYPETWLPYVLVPVVLP